MRGKREDRGHPIDRWLNHVPVDHSVSDHQVEIFMQRYTRGIHSVIARAVRNSDEFQEACQIARIAAFYCMATFDESRGTQLSTYYFEVLKRWIWESLGHFRALVSVPNNAYSNRSHPAHRYLQPEAYSKVDPVMAEVEADRDEGNYEAFLVLKQILFQEDYGQMEDQDLLDRFFELCSLSGLEEAIVEALIDVVQNDRTGIYRSLNKQGIVRGPAQQRVQWLRSYLAFLSDGASDLSQLVQIGLQRLKSDPDTWSYPSYRKRTRQERIQQAWQNRRTQTESNPNTTRKSRHRQQSVNTEHHHLETDGQDCKPVAS